MNGGESAAEAFRQQSQTGSGARRGRQAGIPHHDARSSHNGRVGLGETLKRLAAELHGSIDECLHGAAVEAVHHVRTGSRRVEALVETALRQHAAAPTHGLHKAGAAWLKQLHKVRRAAGKVRDLDVHRKILEKRFLETSAKRGKQTKAAGQRNLGAQAQTVDDWLKDARDRQESRLRKALRKRQPKLAGAQQAFLAALPPQDVMESAGDRSMKELALEDFRRLSEQMPTLAAGNLHEFRKRAKKARYVAEAAGDEDREAQALAEEIKRVQDAIGEWHDWLVLSQEAKSALGKNGAALRQTMEAETERLYVAAIQTAEAVKQRLTVEEHARDQAS